MDVKVNPNFPSLTVAAFHYSYMTFVARQIYVVQGERQAVWCLTQFALINLLCRQHNLKSRVIVYADCYTACERVTALWLLLERHITLRVRSLNSVHNSFRGNLNKRLCDTINCKLWVKQSRIEGLQMRIKSECGGVRKWYKSWIASDRIWWRDISNAGQVLLCGCLVSSRSQA